MVVKRYRGANMQEVLRKVKQDIGSSAVILSTRQVRSGGGVFGLFGKPMLEVTAAEPEMTTISATKPKSVASRVPSPPPSKSLPNGDAQALEQALGHSRIEAYHLLGSLQDEMQELKYTLASSQNVLRQTNEDQGAMRRMQGDLADVRRMVQMLTAQPGLQDQRNLPENLLALHQQLVFGGVEEKFSRRLTQEAAKFIPPKEINEFTYVKVFLARMLMKIIHVTNGMPITQNKPKVFALIGPTGVGKTTTAAKIASQQMLKQHRKTALITVDTYRIGAVEQLQTYARIMEAPLAVVKDRAELQLCIQNFKDFEVIIIDTAGRSQRDEQQMNDLQNLLGGQESIEMCLTLSATTKDEELSDITRRFSDLSLNSVCFTKLDETVSYGCLLNHSIRFKLPIGFLTMGQNVPQDIEIASKERVVDLLLQLSESQ